MTEQHNRTAAPSWQAALILAAVGVAVGAAIGAGTGMWWMMGVLGGTFPGFARLFSRTQH
jgi:hypothetical protein